MPQNKKKSLKFMLQKRNTIVNAPRFRSLMAHISPLIPHNVSRETIYIHWVSLRKAGLFAMRLWIMYDSTRNVNNICNI
jgi:hypothetical protein